MLVRLPRITSVLATAQFFIPAKGLRGGSEVAAGSMSKMSMPPILYGTAWKKERTAGLVKAAVLNGFRGIDTACQPKHYNEGLVGEGWEAAAKQLGLPREAFFLQTKYTPIRGQDPANVPYDPSVPLAKQVEQSVQVSLRNLRTEYIDSLVLHSPLPTMGETLEVWGAMEKAVKAGLVRHLGVSNCYDIAILDALFERAEIPPKAVQNRFYSESGFDVEVRALAASKGAAYQSFWTLTGNMEALMGPEVGMVAASLGLTVPQAMYAFVRSLGIVPLSGTTDEQHMRDDLAVVAADGPVLDQQQQAIMAAALGIPSCDAPPR
ncbi:unnamed protein product [Chrysoparadoxa australica]